MDTAESIIAVGASLGVLIPAFNLIVAVFLTRVYFGRYVRRRHPRTWNDITKKATGSDLASLRLSFDVTPDVARFRTESRDDMGDPEVAARRAIANKAERLCGVTFIAGASWILISAVAIAVLRAN